MPNRLLRPTSHKTKNDRYKRLDQTQPEEFDQAGKKQSDYQRMQSYQALTDYFNSFNK